MCNKIKFTVEDIKRDLKQAEKHWKKAFELGYKGAYERNSEEGIEEIRKGDAILEKYQELCDYPIGFPEGDEIDTFLRVIIRWEEEYRK